MIDDDSFIQIVLKANSYSDIFRSLNLSKTGNMLKHIKNRIEKLNINIDHFVIIKSIPSKIPLNEVFIENSLYKGKGQDLKKKLLKEDLIEDKCSLCGLLPIWNNKPIVLQLDHINGIHNDNRIENLRIVCPNCHVQTDTWGCKQRDKQEKKPRNRKESPTLAEIESRKNQRKVQNRPSKDKLQKLVELDGYAAVGRSFGVTDNTIRKWLR